MMAASIALDDDDRARRRNLACVGTGLWMGASLGLLAASFVWPAGPVFLIGGALAGGILGRIAAPHISIEEWDPPQSHRPFVGTNSPDDDIATE